MYELTPAGQDAIEAWAGSEPVAPTSLKHHAALRVFLGHNTTPAHLIEILEAHRQSLLGALDELETLSVALTGDEAAGYAAIAADWTAELYRGDLRGLERTLKALADMG